MRVIKLLVARFLAVLLLDYFLFYFVPAYLILSVGLHTEIRNDN
jgi:hypothetical protein